MTAQEQRENKKNTLTLAGMWLDPRRQHRHYRSPHRRQEQTNDAGDTTLRGSRWNEMRCLQTSRTSRAIHKTPVLTSVCRRRDGCEKRKDANRVEAVIGLNNEPIEEEQAE